MSKRSIGDAKYMNKRILQNPKYQHVKSRLDTGCSLSKHMERLEELKKNYRYKKGEIFKRLKVTTFAQLVLQVASVSDLNESIMDDVPRLEDVVSVSGEGDHHSDKTDGTPAFNLSHLLTPTIRATPHFPQIHASQCDQWCRRAGSGQGQAERCEPDSLSRPCAAESPYPDCPYLLLDVRDRDLYHQCHIISAHNYPIATLSRTMNPYTKEVLNYGKIIILYDEDERMASQAATTMCERGFENLFMLSGGLKVMALKFPEGMTTGSFPVTCLPSPKGPSGRKQATLRQTPRPAENKWRFTSEDLHKIQNYLDEVLIPSETSSRLNSRMSISSANSNVSSARSSRLGSGSAKSQSSRP